METLRPTREQLSNPESLLVLVNKLHPVQPLSWVPKDLAPIRGILNPKKQELRAEAVEALERMGKVASEAGIHLIALSGYRSFELQQRLFRDYVAADGIELAEGYSARPGHSEHQTGLAIDLDDGSGHAFEASFGETVTGRWLRGNAHNFGFILRYHSGQQPTVGYIYEPWHFRFVGHDIASTMWHNGILNYEDFVHSGPAPHYVAEMSSDQP